MSAGQFVVGKIVQLSTDAPARIAISTDERGPTAAPPVSADDLVAVDEARRILTRLAELRTVNNAHRQVRELLKELDSLAERAHRVIAAIHYQEVAHAAEAEANG